MLPSKGPKLKLKYFGPYKVINKVNHNRYEVEKIGKGPRSGKIHDEMESVIRGDIPCRRAECGIGDKRTHNNKW